MTDQIPTSLAYAKDGEVLSGRTRTISLTRVLAFSGGPFDQPNWPELNLHTNSERARKAGLPDMIASGTQSEGILIGFLISVCGQIWHRCGMMELRFVKPVLVGETITPKLRVLGRAAEGSEIRVNFEAWCETGKGNIPVIGQASCLFVNPRKDTANA